MGKRGYCLPVSMAVFDVSIIAPPSHLPARSNWFLDIAVPKVPTAVSTKWKSKINKINNKMKKTNK